MLMTGTPHGGEVRAVLFESSTGGYVWGVLYTGPDGAREVVEVGYPNCDAAKSEAWRFAQSHNAVFVPARRARP
jgi:hypothetical protein